MVITKNTLNFNISRPVCLTDDLPFFPACRKERLEVKETLALVMYILVALAH